MMKKMTLIKEFICGEEGKPAFIVDAQDWMLRTSTVVRIEKYEADVLVETKNSVYCTARFYDFGYMSQSLIAAMVIQYVMNLNLRHMMSHIKMDRTKLRSMHVC